MYRKPFAILLTLLTLISFRTTAQQITVSEGVLTDNARNRKVPYKLYRPTTLEGVYPIIIFSHGLGGSKNAAAYLGKHLAAHNYIAVHIQHHGSDESIWQGANSREEAVNMLSKSIRNPQSAVNRFNDVPFVIDELEELNNNDDILKGHLDLSKIGMAGHSYGGKSTMVAAGEKIGRRGFSFKEPRIKAALVLSPNVPNRQVDYEQLYADIDIPMFHMTGTNDEIPIPPNNDLKPEQRQIPYQKMHLSDQYLLVLKDAVHGTFSGNVLKQSPDEPRNVQHIEAIKDGTLAFFDYYLNQKTERLAWLRESYSDTLASEDAFEWKAGDGGH
ncbi:MAG: hypothetical protein AAFX87_14985 [Bacteroidota bacterium]